MKVGTSCAAGVSAQGNDLAFLYSIALLNLEFGEVHVHGHESPTVVDDDAISFVVELARQNHFTGVRCVNRRSHWRMEIFATVHAGQLTGVGI